MAGRNNYINFKYDEKTSQLLGNTQLDIIATQKLNEAIKLTKDTDFYNNHKEIYIDLAKLRFALDTPSSDIAKIYHLNVRSIQQWFKKMGWERDLFEAQQLASRKSRDYTKIRRKFKSTMLERFDENQLFGSRVEQYASQCRLHSI